MERPKPYSSQQSNSTFQPQSMRRSSLEQVNPGRSEMHSSSTPINAGDSTRERAKHTVKAGDTLWEIAEDKLGSGSRWQELQKKDGSTFTEREARQLQIGTSVYLPQTNPTNFYQPGSGVQAYTTGLVDNLPGTAQKGAKNSDYGVNRLQTNGNQKIPTQFSGAELLKASQAYPETISVRALTGSTRSAKRPGLTISPAVFYKTSQVSAPQFQTQGISYQKLVDGSPLAQENIQPHGASGNQNLLGLSDNVYLAQHLIGDAAAGYYAGDQVGRRFPAWKSTLGELVTKSTTSRTTEGKPKGFVSADAEELGRRITEHRQKTGEQHPFERLGKYDVATGKFTLNPHLRVDEVTVHETRPIVRRPEGRAGDTWPSLYHQKGPGDTSTKDANSARKKFRKDMGKLMGDAITEYCRTTGNSSPLEKLGTYDPTTGTFKLDSKYAAGHTTSAHNNGRDMFAVEEGAPNSRDGRTREDPRRGGEVLRKRAVDIHGFPIEKELARKLFPELAENAPSHPGWTRGVKVTDKSLDVVRDHLLKTELQNTNTQNPKEEASVRDLSRKVAAGKATDADLTDPKNKKLVEGLRDELKKAAKQEEQTSPQSGKKAKPPKLSLEEMLDEPVRSPNQRARFFNERIELYASYTKALRDSANDRKNAKRQSATKPEGTRSGTSNLDTDSNGSRSSQARGDKPPLIAHRDKPDEANPEKKRSVNPADKSPRQAKKKPGATPRDESPIPRTGDKRSAPPRSNSSGTQAERPRSSTPGGKSSPQVKAEHPRLSNVDTGGKLPKVSNGLEKGLKVTGKLGGKVLKPLGVALDVYELGDAMYKDGGIGENTKKVVKEEAISWGSTAAGAGIGFAVAGPPGALVGGIVGGLAPVAVEYGPKAVKKVGSWVKGLFD